MRSSNATATDSFTQRLSDCRATTVAHLLSQVPDREPRRYLYGPLADHLARAGKSLRPALCLATCAALGGNVADAQPSAAAIEMLHNAFLVHDDVEDDSELRRGRPTMHMEHGVPLAVNAGDMLTALAIRMLRENHEHLGPQLSWRVLDEFDYMMRESLEGQATELGWIRDNPADVAERDYLRMVLKKTCWYSFITPCRIGALVAARDGSGLDRFNRFGFYLGAAFQIQDDLLNLTGDLGRYGKEIAGDLLEGKRTLMLIHLSERLDRADAGRLWAFLGQPRRARSSLDVNWILTRMRAAGSLEYARAASRRLAGAALYEFNQAFRGVGESPDRTFLEHVIRYAVCREL